MTKRKILQKKTDKKGFLNGTFDYLLFIVSCLIVVSFVLFFSGAIFREASNYLSNSLFAVFNIIASIFIAYKISYFGFQSQEKQLQKKLATAAIRHIRTYKTHLLRLKTIVEDKKDRVNQKIDKQYFTEISNHIDHIADGVLASELDIKGTVEGLIDEEYKEENQILVELQHSIEELKRLQDEKDKKGKGKMRELEQKIDNIRSEIAEQVTSLPFGYPSNVAVTGGATPTGAAHAVSTQLSPFPSASPSASVYAALGGRVYSLEDFLRKPSLSSSEKEKKDEKKEFRKKSKKRKK